MMELSRPVKRWLINGIVLTIPLVVTLLVVLVVIDFILGALSPVVTGVKYVWPNEPPTVVIQTTMLLSLFAFVLLVGFIAEYTPGTHISQRVDATMGTIPGVSTVYESMRRASAILADGETDQFKDVKLVEFPHEETYVFGFLTADTPTEIEHSVGEKPMVTIMVPLGPNPTTNGFIMHVPVENIHDVDITVEEAVRSIATLGVSVDGLGDVDLEEKRVDTKSSR